MIRLHLLSCPQGRHCSCVNPRLIDEVFGAILRADGAMKKRKEETTDDYETQPGLPWPI